METELPTNPSNGRADSPPTNSPADDKNSSQNGEGSTGDKEDLTNGRVSPNLARALVSGARFFRPNPFSRVCRRNRFNSGRVNCGGHSATSCSRCPCTQGGNAIDFQNLGLKLRPVLQSFLPAAKPSRFSRGELSFFLLSFLIIWFKKTKTAPTNMVAYVR